MGRLASRVYPGLDEALWTRKRDREMRAETEAGGYASALLDCLAPAESGPRSSRESHLVVVPQVGPNIDTWKAAGGNFFYEIAQAAREYAGAEKVTIFGVEAGEPAHEWHARLIRFLVESGATHLIAGDPVAMAGGGNAHLGGLGGARIALAEGAEDFGAQVLGARFLMVLGHEYCGAVDAAVKGGKVGGNIDSIIDVIAPAASRAKADPDKTDLLNKAIAENVREVLSAINKRSPALTAMAAKGELKIVGARYDLDGGDVTLVPGGK